MSTRFIFSLISAVFLTFILADQRSKTVLRNAEICFKNRHQGGLLTAEYLKLHCEPVNWSFSSRNSIFDSNFELTSSASISRFLARKFPLTHLYGLTVLQKTEVDHWLSFASAHLNCALKFSTALKYLDHVLKGATYLVGHALTIADFSICGVLHVSESWHNLHESAPVNVLRYYSFLCEQVPFTSVIKCLSKMAVKAADTVDHVVKKDEGKFVELPGAEYGKVVTRFPPEASGYLHIGHAKAALLNAHYRDMFRGKFIMRFDDTNPAKESAEFEKVIMEDLKLLGIAYDHLSHTSDFFDTLLDKCEQLIREGKLYCDDTDPETMKKEREERTESKNRGNSIEVNLSMWEEMKKGSEVGQRCCVRAKIDMSSNVGCMRDPTFYRCKREAHVRTGNKYIVYPTYDFACPIVDSVEGVTHALRTTEYHDRDEQYYWVLDALSPDHLPGVIIHYRANGWGRISKAGMRKPYIYEYSRLNLQNTVLSKRKLTWFVDQGLVDGWDDPRLPTVRGILRRGMTVEGLKQFIETQGSSRSVVMMEWDKIWAVNRKVIDPIVPRYTALLRGDAVPVTISGAVVESRKVCKHPKNGDVGLKTVWYGPDIYIDGADALCMKEGEVVTCINWGNITVKTIVRDMCMKITSILADLNLENTDYKKTQKITWLANIQTADGTGSGALTPTVCVHHNHIITKAVLDKDEDFRQYINPDSRTYCHMLGDPCLSLLKEGEIIQLQRRGYFICDKPYIPVSVYIGRASPCVLLSIPDGHHKDMPKAGSKYKEDKSKITCNESTGSRKRSKIAEASHKVEQPMNLSLQRTREELESEILLQGDAVRRMKSGKAVKDDIAKEVKELLALKAQYKVMTGTEWSASKPGASSCDRAPVTDASMPTLLSVPCMSVNVAACFPQELTVVDSPSVSTASGSDAVSSLTGDSISDSRSDITATVATMKSSAEDVHAEMQRQGDRVRRLKSEKASKTEVDIAVQLLLSLKAKYKEITGLDLATGMKKSKKQAKCDMAVSNDKMEDGWTKDGPSIEKEGVGDNDREVKKVTRLGLEVLKAQDVSEWYQQVITKSEMIEYYNVSGCYILRPWAYAIWDIIKEFFDKEIKKLGIENCYFPMFVSQSALEKEKTHIEDFAPEVAWVTRSGQSDLAEPLAIRPTSETVMYPSYAKWIKSHRDLPLRLNQWCNVVRWEFKHPQPFLRSREFLWQEGHTAWADREGALKEMYVILELYARVYEELLAVPVFRGRKTEKEKFAGSDMTTTIEAFISDNGRAIQGATSHHLGQNFSKMFEIMFEHPDTKQKEYVYQNSWGMTTRTIGVMTLVHGDDSGLVLPPRVACLQVIIIPCGVTASLPAHVTDDLLRCCERVATELRLKDIRARTDLRDNYSPGWKFNHWELKGVPLRLELGPRDMKTHQVVLVRRDTGERCSVSDCGLPNTVSTLLDNIQDNLYHRAKTDMMKSVIVTDDWVEFCNAVDRKQLIQAPFCCEIACEDRIKKDSSRDAATDEAAPAMGAKSLCIPFQQPAELSPGTKCLYPTCQNPAQAYVLFGRSY